MKNKTRQNLAGFGCTYFDHFVIKNKVSLELNTAHYTKLCHKQK